MCTKVGVGLPTYLEVRLQLQLKKNLRPLKLKLSRAHLVLTNSMSMAEEAPSFRKSELLTSQTSKSINYINTTIFALIHTIILIAGTLRSSSTDIQGCLVLQHIQDALRSYVALESPLITYGKRNMKSLLSKANELKCLWKWEVISPFMPCRIPVHRLCASRHQSVDRSN